MSQNTIAGIGKGTGLRCKVVRIRRTAALRTDDVFVRIFERGQLAAAEIAVAVRHRVGVTVAQIGGDVALAVREIRAHQYVKRFVTAVLRGAGGRVAVKASNETLNSGVAVFVPV